MTTQSEETLKAFNIVVDVMRQQGAPFEMLSALEFARDHYKHKVAKEKLDANYTPYPRCF